MFNVYPSVTGGNQFGGNSVFTACDAYSFFWLIFLHHFFLEYVLVAYVTHRFINRHSSLSKISLFISFFWLHGVNILRMEVNEVFRGTTKSHFTTVLLYNSTPM